MGAWSVAGKECGCKAFLLIISLWSPVCLPSVHVPAIATVGLHDLRGVVYALAGKFGDYIPISWTDSNAPYAKWTDKSMPDPEDIGGYMSAWLIISFDK